MIIENKNLNKKGSLIVKTLRELNRLEAAPLFLSIVEEIDTFMLMSDSAVVEMTNKLSKEFIEDIERMKKN